MHCSCSAEDRAFQRRFEDLEIEAGGFTHEGHIQLAYVYLCDRSVEEAYEHYRRSIRAFLAHHEIDPAIYSETITFAWLLAVRHFMEEAGATRSASGLTALFPAMLDSKIMLSHYSSGLLFSDDARGRFVAPDLDPIPRSE